MFAQARKAGLDIDGLGAKMAAEKIRLMQSYKSGGLPTPDTRTMTVTSLQKVH